MSASEKLRALDGEAEAIARCLRYPAVPNVYDADAWSALATLRNALPLIADVVEAAEGAVRVGAHGPLGSALTALRESLLERGEQ